MGQFDDFLLQRALRTNPAFAKNYYMQQNQQADQERLMGLLGSTGTPEQKYATEGPTEGPMMPGQARQAMPFNQVTQEAVQGTGLLGGQTSPQELGLKMMTGNLPNTRVTGSNLLMQAMKPKEQGRAMTNIEFFQKDPEGFNRMQQATTRPSTTVTVNDKLRSVGDQIELDDKLAQAKNSREFVTGTINTGISSGEQLNNIDTMIGLINSGAETGFGEEYLINAKQLLSRFGVKYPELAGQEKLQTLMGDLVMDRVAQTKGAVSEREMALFKEYSANVGKTEEGNLAVLDFTKQKANRNIEMSKLARKLQLAGARAGVIQDALLQYRTENPIKPYKTQGQMKGSKRVKWGDL